MTENTAIERLDYSKPPPGYTVQVDGAKAHTPGAWVWTTTTSVQVRREMMRQLRGLA